MEAEALRDGVRLAVDMSLQHVVVEIDAVVVVNLLKDLSPSKSIITICQEVKELSWFFLALRIFM
jgi:hypothetical protein